MELVTPTLPPSKADASSVDPVDQLFGAVRSVCSSIRPALASIGLGGGSVDASVGRLGRSEELAEIFKLLKTDPRTLAPGEPLITQGIPSTAMYLIVEGQLEIRCARSL